MHNIAVFASGAGSNAENIIKYFNKSGNKVATVSLVVSNNPQALVLEKAKKHKVPYLVLDKDSLSNPGVLLTSLKNFSIDFIVLAGYLKKIPLSLIDAYSEKIINIHPALLPKFGGKGMYGMRVHEAVKEASESTSGISVHFVNEHYDEGNIIKQIAVDIDPEDLPEDIMRKVQKLEHKFYPEIIETLLKEI